MCALQAGDATRLGELLDEGAEVNVRDGFGESALVKANRGSHHLVSIRKEHNNAHIPQRPQAVVPNTLLRSPRRTHRQSRGCFRAGLPAAAGERGRPLRSAAVSLGAATLPLLPGVCPHCRSWLNASAVSVRTLQTFEHCTTWFLSSFPFSRRYLALWEEVQFDGEALLELDDRGLAEDVCIGVGAHRKIILKKVAELRVRAAAVTSTGNTAQRQRAIESVMALTDSVAKRELIAAQQQNENLRTQLETAEATLQARASGLGSGAMALEDGGPAALVGEELFRGGVLRLSLKLPTNEHVRIEVPEQMLVAELKVKVLPYCDIPARQQSLTHKFKDLDDTKTLAGCGIVDLSVLHVRRKVWPPTAWTVLQKR